MLVHSALIAMFALPALINGGQIPSVEGVVGGVPSPNAKASKNIKMTVSIGDSPTPGDLRVVENSGICETTPGVYQASGYGDLAEDKSIWFWFFAARNNPDTAPLITWFNGGPGSSSMIGLFQELGPCRINNQSTRVDLNPTSWNNDANVPAAADVWQFLQIWFADSRFGKYASREFGIWTESYGGHYGPTFAAYFLKQNAAIKSETVTGVPINLKVLGIGNGITDPVSQYPGYIEYAQSNPYHPLVDPPVIASAERAWVLQGGCKDQITACNDEGTDLDCSGAQEYCDREILSPLSGGWDVYYVPVANPDPYPPSLDPYLTDPTLARKIGAEATWQETNQGVYDNFAATGDLMRSARPDLETVINAGVRTVIYDGDADYIVNYMGVEAMVDSLQTQFSSLFAKQSFANFTVNGAPAGLYKNAGTFSYLRVFGAGHEVPAYLWRGVSRGAAALQMFTQIMSGDQLSGT
ncbi:serine carboxypeptidase [Russula earlei]|uniref:Serine carboxypeptidase n=1 Tax=Russula earlei TaxID=71964 RepID=A0ACC0U0M0_9AGAM|nr:serine carboxypeptidase [Russula earlei]